MRGRMPFALATAVLFAAPSFAESCEGLTKLALPRVTISLAAAVPAGPFGLPPAETRKVELPAFCRVAGVIAPEIRFEVWLPERWNKKFVAVGNGGLAGSISYGAMVMPLEQGYATASTDTGHSGNGNDASWALGHFERVVDFAHRGVHAMTGASKAIIAAYYSAAPAHSYFTGCSQGGAEALMEAQRYPRDYDGIVAGDPANNWTRHYTGGHLWAARAMDGDGYLPANKIQAIADAVNSACDGLDGIRDGVLNDPRRCHFDPSTLLCKSGDGADCLTAAQVESVKKLYEGARDTEGDQLYPGLLPGGEAGPGGWQTWITGSKPGSGGHAGLGLPFFQYIVFEDPNWDFRTFRFEAPKGFDSDVDLTDAKLAAIFNATDPDLSAFRANGGKLIQYHGLSDPDITPLNSIEYYESVAKAMSHNGNHGFRETGEFYRLFLVPGMQHCGGGPGPAPNAKLLLETIDQWVDGGKAPEKIIASHSTSGKVDRTRPLCPYPKEAQWTGRGSTDEAENFVCGLPARP